MFTLVLSQSFMAALLGQAAPDFPAELQARALAATVRVSNPAKNSEGSGVIVGRTGPLMYVLTAEHIITGADAVEISLFLDKGPRTYRNGRVVARSGDRRDLALVRLTVDEKTLSVLPVCPAPAVPKADQFPTLALGCTAGEAPLALEYRILVKRKAQQKGTADTAYFWEVTGAIAKGRSGGPLIDGRGFVMGICSGTNDGKGYYTHIQEIQRFLQQQRFEWLAEKDGNGPRIADP